MISSHFHCEACDHTAPRGHLDVVTVADDRDQMNGRPLAGFFDTYVCPASGSDEVVDWYETEEDET